MQNIGYSNTSLIPVLFEGRTAAWSETAGPFTASAGACLTVIVLVHDHTRFSSRPLFSRVVICGFMTSHCSSKLVRNSLAGKLERDLVMGMGQGTCDALTHKQCEDICQTTCESVQ